MYEKLRHLSPYIKDVITNRKFVIHNCIKDMIENQKNCQVLILACGWDPVMIKMSSQFPENFFFGVDSESIELQQKLAKKILPQANIFYLKINIINAEDLIKKLLLAGWNPIQPLCVVAEGISYYVPKEPFWNVIKHLRQRAESNFSICGDFLLDIKKVNLSKIGKQISREVFGMIKRECSLTDYYSYTKDQIQRELQKLDLQNIAFFEQNQIQKNRTEKSQPWKEGDSYIQMFVAKEE